MKLGAGARKFQGSTLSSLTDGFFKVYQNRGKSEVRDTPRSDGGKVWLGPYGEEPPSGVPACMVRPTRHVLRCFSWLNH